MRFTTKTEYGLVCLIYIMKHANANLVTLSEIVDHEKYSPAYIDKILQGLRAATIITSFQGKQGGYTLARPAREITLKEIIEALEGTTFDIFCAPDIREKIVCTHFCTCGVRPIWMRTKEILDHFFNSVTLEDIAKEEHHIQDLVTIKG